MVDLNCGHRINQEVKVWREGSSLNIQTKDTVLAAAAPLLTHTFLIGAVMHKSRMSAAPCCEGEQLHWFAWM